MSDGSFVRGTTPPLVIKIKKADLDVTQIDELELTITQLINGVPSSARPVETCKSGFSLIKHLADVTIDAEANTLTYCFTEDETFSFKENDGIALQCRFRVGDNIVATGERRLKAERLLSNRKFDDAST